MMHLKTAEMVQFKKPMSLLGKLRQVYKNIPTVYCSHFRLDRGLEPRLGLGFPYCVRQFMERG